MPPGPAYNWLCVVCSATDIISRAARIRATQLAPRSSPLTAKKRKESPEGRSQKSLHDTEADAPELQVPPSVALSSTGSTEAVQNLTRHESGSSLEIPPDKWKSSALGGIHPDESPLAYNVDPPPYSLPSRNLQSSKVPSSRIGRLFHYGGLAASLGYGAASEIIRRTGSGANGQQSSVMMTEANITRIVSKLSQMRGAALKLGQFFSIQDTHVLPTEIDKIFRRVQDSAHYIPDWQMEKVMSTSLGANWASNFSSFERLPFAAASIGQVHKATLAPTVSPTGKPEPVAVKIQYPNIVNSIDSDVGYIKLLLSAGKLLPKGLFLDRTIKVLKEELADECNYTREASYLRLFGSPAYLGNDNRFKVPWVWEGSTECVLVMERVDGTSVGDADISGLSGQDRNDIAAWIMELCLKELFEFRVMQTDPNWSNFLWNSYTRQVELVDFGATREYSKEFMDHWLKLLQAAASEDRDACVEWSLKLGYLTGQENEIMLNAHVSSMILLATPFQASASQPFEFGHGSKWSEITAEIRAHIPIMLKHRLTPPPRETYSLNRKLSGTFLLASRLDASINAKEIWDRIVQKYDFSS
ncbi:ABC1-domain-containing protein [Tricholoma matsutake]|nr:ABC1-domain-containing protein [Tricholoma matsutake 945]